MVTLSTTGTPGHGPGRIRIRLARDALVALAALLWSASFTAARGVSVDCTGTGGCPSHGVAVEEWIGFETAVADTLLGRVLSTSDRTPVFGARIRLGQSPELRETRSDSVGRFRFPEVRSGRYRLHVEAFGYRTRQVTVTVPEEGTGRVELLLEPLENANSDVQGGTVQGRVVEGESGEPVVDALVLIEGTTLTTTTDPGGFFRIEGVPPGPTVLRIRRIGYATARVHLNLREGELLSRRIEVATQALEMEAINVTADAISRAEGELGTASVIDEEAIDNTSAASLSNILELTPGVPLQPPGIGEERQFALRTVPTPGIPTLVQGPSAADLASFGTSIVLDGVPLSNNANLQTLGPRGAFDLPLPSTAGGGIDLRRIPANTLERVEVIRGIPSVRYGDLTAGAVVIYTKAGEVAPEFDVQVDPRTGSGAAVGGTGIGGGQTGTLTLDVTRTRISPGVRNELGTRIAGQLSHRARAGLDPATGGPRFLLDSRLDFFRLREELPLRPELVPGRASERDDIGFRLNERARIGLGPSTRVSVTAALSGTMQETFDQQQAEPTATPLTTRRTDGRERGAFLVGSYISEVSLDGEPFSLFIRTEAESERRWFGASHRLRAGSVIRREWNAGSGQDFDMERPPRIPFNGVQGFLRPRSFEPIQPLVGSAFYLDDRVTKLFGGARLTAQGGARVDLLHEGDTWATGVRDAEIQPRLNVEFAPVPGLRFRAGVGRTAKLPSMDDLNPPTQYHDLVNVNFFADDPAERLAVLTTRTRDPTNPALGFSTGEKAEVGLELDIGGNAGVSVVAFQDVIEDGVGIGFTPDFLERELFAVEDTADGVPPVIVEPPMAVDTVPILIRQPRNNLRLENRGIEVTAFLPEFEPLRTQIQVQGAWSQSEFSREGLDFGPQSLWSTFQLRPDDPRSPFWDAATGRGERAILTYRAVHRQPELGLLVTAVFQHYVEESSRVLAATDTLAFRGFITRTGELVEVPPDRRDDPEFADLRRARSGLLTDPDDVPMDWIFSLRVAKTLPMDGRLSLYAFNALNREGTVSSRGLAGRLFPNVRFGLEAQFPVLQLFQ